MKEYTVVLQAEAFVTATFVIDAKNEQEAVKIAKKDFIGMTSMIDFDEIEIVSGTVTSEVSLS